MLTKNNKELQRALHALEVSPEVSRILYKIWKEVDSAYADQIYTLHRDGLKLLDLSAELVVTIRAWDMHNHRPFRTLVDASTGKDVPGDTTFHKLEKQILKMRRTWKPRDTRAAKATRRGNGRQRT